MLKSVLHVSSARTWRGGEQQIAYLVEELQAKGIQQYVFCVENTPMAAWCKTHEIQHFTYKKRSSISPKISEKIAAISYIKNISIVHAHDSHAHTYAFLSIILNWNPTPIIVSRRVDFPIRKGFLSRWKYNHSSIRKIICISEKIKEIIAKDIKDKNRLRVVHSGIDIDRFKQPKSSLLRLQYEIPSDHFIIANVAAIAAHKDYFTFVDTAKRLLDVGVKAMFLIIGEDGGEEAKVRAYIEQLGIEKSIVLTGFRSDIPKILPEIDVFLFTSKEEGLGTSVLDAFASNIPVVATKAGGVSEMIVDKKTGLLADVGNAEELAKQVQRILYDPVLKKELVNNAQSKLQHFTKRKMAEGVLRIYQEVLE